jgi:hypothetical protein
MRGEQDDFRGGTALLGHRHDVEARAVGHREVGENDRKRLGMLVDGLGRAAKARCRHDRVTLAAEQDFQHLPQTRLVLDDE